MNRSHRPGPRGGGRALAWALLALSLAVAAGLTARRSPPRRLWGDEGTYVAMAASLARDGDLVFGEPDRRWARARRPEGGVAVILQRAGGKIAYSKPPVYAVVAAPFYAALGEVGLLALNLTALAAAALVGWLALRRRWPAGAASLTLVTFLACSPLLPYLGWKMSEALQAALGLAGLALVCAGLRAPAVGSGRGRLFDHPLAVAAGAAALGLLASMRLPNAALAGAAVLACLLHRRWRRAAAVAALAGLGLAAAAAGGLALQGAANPYKSERTTFNGVTGYPAVAGGTAGDRFAAAPARSGLGARPEGPPSAVAYSALYLVVGRHSGLLAYFPAALIFLLWGLWRPDRLALALFAGVAAIAAFYLLWQPWNYFGGSTFLGNRYLLPAYPALLLALSRPPPRGLLAPAWVLAALAALSAALSPARAAPERMLSQTHAAGGLFRQLPYESTAAEIDGQLDRYWSGDLVRFVDPFAAVGDHAVGLDSAAPAAEIAVATARPPAPLIWLARPDAPGARLEIADWRGRSSFPLDPAGTAPTLVRYEPARPWRRHRLWLGYDALYRVHLLRLAARRDAGPVTVELRYLGDGTAERRSCSHEVVSLALPRRAAAGERGEIEVVVANRGDWTWTGDDVLPVFLSYRLYPAGGGAAIEGERRPVAPPVPAGGTLAARLPVTWPARPGAYRLAVDLVVEPLFWCADRAGEPLGEGPVEVRADAPAATAPAAAVG